MKKQAEYAKKHYENNKQKIKNRASLSKQKNRERNKQYLENYKSNKSCLDCGETNSIVLEFDHVIGVKLGNVINMAYSPVGLKKLKEEIEKCELVCANCHRIRTHKRNIASGR